MISIVNQNDIGLLSELLQKKIVVIADIFRNKTVVVAFSGGIDSSLVCVFAKFYAKNVQAVIISSPMTPSQELKQASTFSTTLGIPLEVLSIDTLSNPKIASNLPDRCYYCKKEILATLERYRQSKKFDLLVDGTNYSDLSLVRAGLKALKESEAKSPLAIAKISKSEIIEISRTLKLPSAEIPSQACLASRIPFNVPLSKDILQIIDQAEQGVRQILNDFHSNLRVRIHPVADSKQFLARIEAGDNIWQIVTDPEKRKKIVDLLTQIGFIFCTIDLDGFHSGSMDKALKKV